MKTKNENTDAQILAAAKHVFQRKGMDGARMQEIAHEAGINKALLHYYYRSKQLLFEAVFKHAFALIAPALHNILNSDVSIEEKIKQFTFNYISFVNEHPYLPNFIIQELNRDSKFLIKLKSEANFPNLEKFKKQVQADVKKGLYKPIKAEQLFINVMALNVFPFVAKPLLQNVINIDEATYNQLIEDRKTEVANFIINAIKN